MRPDVTDKLIHWTRGATDMDAFGRLLNIVLNEHHIRGNNGNVRSGDRCVCLSEAPLAILPGGLVHPEAFSKYSGFGVMLEKQFVYAAGGRPVIYQSEDEFGLLHADLQWRHVRYEPPHVDFTWEREWRVRCDSFEVDPTRAVIVVPGAEWIDMLEAEHDDHQEFQQREYALILGETIAVQYHEPFPWSVAILPTP